MPGRATPSRPRPGGGLVGAVARGLALPQLVLFGDELLDALMNLVVIHGDILGGRRAPDQYAWRVIGPAKAAGRGACSGEVGVNGLNVSPGGPIRSGDS